MTTAALDRARYVSFTTFRRDGSPVSTPLWLAGGGGRYLFMTASDSGKVKRLRRDPLVHVAVSDARGRVIDGTTTFAGTARLLSGTESSEAVRTVQRRYGWQASAIETIQVLGALVRRRTRTEVIGIELLVSGIGRSTP